MAYDFLNKHNFSTEFPAAIINYEFSCSRCNRKVHKPRLHEVANGGHSTEIEACANLLLGNEDRAVELITQDCEKQYTNILMYGRWKITEAVLPRIHNALKLSAPPMRLVQHD